MISTAFILSLQITAIYAMFQQGMLLERLKVLPANLMDKAFGIRNSIYIQKPLWECLPCMASFWTIVLTFSFDIKLMLLVCGINLIIEKVIE